MGGGQTPEEASLAQAPIPFEIHTERPTVGGARWRTTPLGVATVARLNQRIDGPVDLRRPTRLIRRADPRTYLVLLTTRGLTVTDQDGSRARLHPADLVVLDSSRPLSIGFHPGRDSTHECTLLMVPRSDVTLPPDAVRALIGTRLVGHEPVAALFATFLTRLAQDADDYGQANATRLSRTAIDLVNALVSARLERDRGPATRPRQALLTQIQAYALRHLGNPALAPDLIATAHHMSTRALHALFQEHDLTVAAWIRRCRLERCHQDLSDPGQRDRPIQAIRARWGFTDAAVFSRSFRAAYGLGPQAFRRSLPAG